MVWKISKKYLIIDKNIYKDQTILVTGGAGAIGSNLVRKISETGAHKVIILDDLSASYEWNIPNLPNVLFVKGSITNDIDLKRVFKENPSSFDPCFFYLYIESIYPHGFRKSGLWSKSFGCRIGKSTYKARRPKE